MKNQIIIYEGDEGQPKIEVNLKNETVWLSQAQMSELFGRDQSVISRHINNIYTEAELDKQSTMQNMHTAISDKPVAFYNLDVIISVGYRVKSLSGTHFRIWATQILKEYMIKGFAVDDERLKNMGGGKYWKELLDRIRDIRSSEKVLYRQVLDLYATAVDYNPKTTASAKFFKTVQNKLHFAAHGHTAAEVIYLRVDSDKPFAGLTNFKGADPIQAEAMIAKNYLELSELKVLNNLVSAYFDLAEINAMEQKPMRMKDFIQELDNILKSTRRKLLYNAGKISHKKAKEKAALEYQRYKGKNLSQVEKSYLKAIKAVEKKVKKKVK